MENFKKPNFLLYSKNFQQFMEEITNELNIILPQDALIVPKDLWDRFENYFTKMFKCIL